MEYHYVTNDNTSIALILFLSVTSCTAEIDFSSLRRLITFPSTMAQKRRYHFTILLIHKGIKDSMDIREINNEFAMTNDIKLKTTAFFDYVIVHKLFYGIARRFPNVAVQ